MSCSKIQMKLYICIFLTFDNKNIFTYKNSFSILTYSCRQNFLLLALLDLDINLYFGLLCYPQGKMVSYGMFTQNPLKESKMVFFRCASKS